MITVVRFLKTYSNLTPSEKGIKQIPVPVGAVKKYVKDAGLKPKTPEFYMGKGLKFIKYRDDAGNLDATQTIKMPAHQCTRQNWAAYFLGKSNLPEEINDDLELMYLLRHGLPNKNRQSLVPLLKNKPTWNFR